MRKRFVLVWASIALLISLALPVTVFAGHGVFYRIIGSSCTAGQAQLALNFVAKGGTDVNRFKVRSWVEQRPTAGGSWTRGFHFPQIDQTFTADGTRHRLTIDRCYNDDSSVYTRIVVHLQAFDDAGIVWGGIVHGSKV